MKISVHTMALAAGALTLLLAPSARAACSAPGTKAGLFSAKLLPPNALPARTESNETESDASIVGLWNTTFLIGSGPAIWDQGFELWHSDGTEMNVDNAVPPVLGNVCVGVYKRTGPRTFKLRHVTWNWDLSGNLTGTFLLVMTVTVNSHGDAFAGNYVSDSFDLSGNVIPALHAAGVVKGTRITVD